MSVVGQQTGLAVHIHERIDLDQVEADHAARLATPCSKARTS